MGQRDGSRQSRGTLMFFFLVLTLNAFACRVVLYFTTCLEDSDLSRGGKYTSTEHM